MGLLVSGSKDNLIKIWDYRTDAASVRILLFLAVQGKHVDMMPS